MCCLNLFVSLCCGLLLFYKLQCADPRGLRSFFEDDDWKQYGSIDVVMDMVLVLAVCLAL